MKLYFSKIPGSPTFSRRVQLLPGAGVQLLISIESYYIEHQFSRGGVADPLLPSPHPSGYRHDIEKCFVLLFIYSIQLTKKNL